MTIVQIRIDQEEGCFASYFNYEFALLNINQRRYAIGRVTLDFFGPERYEPTEDQDREYETDRIAWSIPTKEVRTIFTEED